MRGLDNLEKTQHPSLFYCFNPIYLRVWASDLIYIAKSLQILDLYLI